MTLASEAQMKTQIGKLCDLLHETYNYGSVNTPNLVTMIDSVEADLRGEHVARTASGIRAFRGAIGSALSPSVIRGLLGPALVDLAKVYGLTVNSDVDAVRRIYEYMHNNSLSVNSRGFSFGSPGSFSGTGNGNIRRLTKDVKGYDIEVGIAESFKATCRADQLTTGVHNEVFEVVTNTGQVDGLERRGSNLRGSLTCLAAKDSMFANPSFTSGTSGSSVPSWDFTTGAATDTAKDTTNYYRSASQADSSPAALQLNATLTIRQKASTRGWRFNPGVPYYFQVAYNRQVGSASGTLTITLGSKSTNVAVAAQTGWNILYLPVTYSNCWPDNFMQNNLEASIGWSKTSGNLLIDDVMLVPMSQFRGQWYVAVGGSTPFVRLDNFSWSDSISSDSIIQYWISRGYGLWLPSNAAGSETWVDP